MSAPAQLAAVRALLRAALEAVDGAQAALEAAPAAGPRPEAYLTTGEAARRAGAAQDTVLAWISKGLLPATRPQGVKGWRIRPADLEAFLAGQATGAAPPPSRLEDHRARRVAELAAAARKGGR